jgi:Mg-chelatase subunit ChlD
MWLWLLPALVPLVFLLHARRRRDLPVASLVVWRRVAATTASAPERRRFPWRDPRLWLQVLAVVAAVLALAQPVLGGGGRTVHWVVVVDASTSMNAIDLAPSRLAAARATVAARWGAAAGGERVSVVRAGPTARVVAARWPTGPALVGALEALAPGDGPPDWAGAAARVRAVVDPSDELRVVVLTDAYGAAAARAALAATGVADAVDGGVDLEVVVLGDALVNVGIGDVAAALRGDRPDQWSITGRVATVGLQPDEVVRVVAAYRPFGGDTFLPWGGADVALGADGTATFEVPLDLPGPGEVEVRGPSGDRLAVDDRAVLVLRPEPVRVAVVGPREPALLRALAAVGGLEVFAAETVPDPEAAAAFDLVVVTGDVVGVPATSTLWLGAVPEGIAAAEARTAPLPPLRVGAHALVRDLDPSALGLARAIPLRDLAGTTPLLTAGEDTLAWARTTATGRQVVVGFGLGDGDWPAQLSFPAFIAAVVDWATPGASGAGVDGCRVGAACAWPREAFAGDWVLRDPTGAASVRPDALLEVSDDPLADAVWDGAWFDAGFVPERTGRYALETASGQVGLPVATEPIGGEPVAESTATSQVASAAPRALGRWLAALALGFVLADAIALVASASFAARRRLWRPLAWTLAVVGGPLPWPGSGGRAVWVGPVGAASQRADAERGSPGWAWSSVGVQPVGADALAGADAASAATDAWATEARASDVATALELALALPTDGAGARRVVVASDVRALAASDWVPLARRAAATGTVVDVVPPVPGADPSAAVPAVAAPTAVAFAQVLVPEGVRAGARFTLGASVQAPTGTRWRVEATLVDAPAADATAGEAEGASDEAADPGASSAAPVASAGAEAAGVGVAAADLELQAGATGELRYRLALFEEGVEEPRAATTVAVAVGARPQVLVVASDPEEGALLVEGLTAQAIDVRTVIPFRMPSSLEALAAYDAVALVNVAASEVFTAYQEMLETYVRELGGGLVLFGGPTAYGPGGYFRTPLEDLSPLSAQITEDAPEVSMAFVLDRSGSMNAGVGPSTRMDVAKVATLEALELLGERSEAALIVFDAEAQVLLPLRSVTDVAAFESALASVNAAGGTAIYPALVAAYELMQATDAATRHVVVMTDGLSQEGDFATVLGQLRDLGIATSFVGVGDAADRRQLTTLANLSGGALHFALDFRALPSLLAQEALMLSATPIELGPTRGDWVAGSVPAFLEGVVSGPPPLLQGYVRTTAKDEADVHLVERDEDDPLLASWRYGLGRVVAFASEADGPWAQAWTTAPEYARLWSQTLRWTAERAVRDAWSLAVAGGDGVLDVELAHPSDVEADALAVRVVELRAEDGSRLASRPLVATGDGRWLARFEVDPGWRGVLEVRVAAAPELGLEAPLVRSVAWPPAPVPAIRSDGIGLGQLALATGGEVRAAGAVDLGAVAPTWRWGPRPELWLLLGLIAFLGGLIVRYGAWAAWFGRLRRVR